MTEHTPSQCNLLVRAPRRLGTMAALFLVGCQVLSGLNELEADGKNERDAGEAHDGGDFTRIDRVPRTDAKDASSGDASPSVTDDNGYAGGAGGAGGKRDAGRGGSDASDAGAAGAPAAGSGGTTPTAGSGGSTQPPPKAECTPPADDGENCDNTAQCGCKSSENCVFFNDIHDQFKLACRATGTQELYKACNTQDQDCQRGYQCMDGLCRAPCEDSTSQCPNAGSRCIQSLDPHGLPVMGLYLCTQTCNPLNPTQEDETFHNCGKGQICYVNLQGSAYYTDCRSGSHDATSRGGYRCMLDDDCAEGHFCASDNRCHAFCRVGASDCSAGQTCSPWDKKVSAKDTEFGACICPDVPPESGSCDLKQQCGCQPGDKCDVLNDGLSACIAAGSGSYAAPCTYLEDCQAGYTCYDSSCHRLCEPTAVPTGCGSGPCLGFPVTSAPTPEVHICRGGFGGTCTNVASTGSVLLADCERRDRTTVVPAMLDLDTAIANDNGQLVFRPPGDFFRVCRNVAVASDGYLDAECETTTPGTFIATSLNLNDHVANLDGQLIFH